MARVKKPLSDATLRSMTTPGIFGDGRNLYCRVGKTGARSWVFVYFTNGRRREMGLGAYPQVGLKRARDLASAAHDAIAQGLDPITERKKQNPPTLKEVSALFTKEFAKRVTPAVSKRWDDLIEQHGGELRHTPINKIDTHQIQVQLKKVQAIAPTSAKALRIRLHRLIEFATTAGYREGPNPARWQDHLSNVIAALGKDVSEPHPMMHYGDVPVFYQMMRDHERISHQALAMVIATACRSAEIIGLTWGEVDMTARTITIPKHRMKMRKEHIVPLTEAAVWILARRLLDTGSNPRPTDHVFPGRLSTDEKTRPMSKSTLSTLMRENNHSGTPHGFRAAYAVWTAEQTNIPDHLAQMNLAHETSSEVARVYQRSKLLEKRREALDAWSSYLLAPAEKKAA